MFVQLKSRRKEKKPCRIEFIENAMRRNGQKKLAILDGREELEKRNK